jgi:hypothetical protein
MAVGGRQARHAGRAEQPLGLGGEERKAERGGAGHVEVEAQADQGPALIGQRAGHGGWALAAEMADQNVSMGGQRLDGLSVRPGQTVPPGEIEQGDGAGGGDRRRPGLAVAARRAVPSEPGRPCRSQQRRVGELGKPGEGMDGGADGRFGRRVDQRVELPRSHPRRLAGERHKPRLGQGIGR